MMKTILICVGTVLGLQLIGVTQGGANAPEALGGPKAGTPKGAVLRAAA